MNTPKTEQTNELIKMIKRQTDYSEEIIKEKLQEKNAEEIILEYNGVDTNKPKEDNMSTNQKIFKSIREQFNQSKTS